MEQDQCDDGNPAVSASICFGTLPATCHGKIRDTQEAAKMLDLALDLTPAEDRDANSMAGDWVDMDGNAVKVDVADKTSCVVNISRPPLQQLQLNMWQSASKEWHCGDAALDANQSSELCLMWRFPCGRSSVWMRQQSIWDGWHEHGSWLPVWETEDGYGPWVTKVPSCDKDDSAPVCQLDQLASYLSGGQSTTMMMPQVQADGTMTLIPAKELSQPQCKTNDSMNNVEKADDNFVFAENDFPALGK